MSEKQSASARCEHASEDLHEQPCRTTAHDEARALAAGPLERLVGFVEESRFQHEENADLRAALASRAAIEQAKGMVMARYRATPDQAFKILTRWSQQRNVKLRVLAQKLVQSASPAVSRRDSPELPVPLLLGHPADLDLSEPEGPPTSAEAVHPWVSRQRRVD